MSGLGDGEDGEGEAGDDRDGTRIVHLDSACGRLGWRRTWNRENRGCKCDGCEDSADPEIPTPAQELPNNTGNEDASEKPKHCSCAIDREHEILPWSRSIQ